MFIPMNSFFIMLIILISIILVSNMIFFIHVIGWYPFGRLSGRPRQAYFPIRSEYAGRKLPTHQFQVLNAWNESMRRWSRKEIYNIKDPSGSLEKAIAQFQKDPTEKNFDILVHLSNHISNRVRYDDRINDLIESASEISLNRPSGK